MRPRSNPVHELAQSRMVQIEQDILSKNNGYAAGQPSAASTSAASSR
jgi:hypothetical protein